MSFGTQTVDFTEQGAKINSEVYCDTLKKAEKSHSEQMVRHLRSDSFFFIA